MGFATKAGRAAREARLVKWMFGAMLAQTAVIVGFVGVVPLLKAASARPRRTALA